jgi:cyclopropane fatty-acyl-phospholipid synthase-like methyltransferase
VLGRKRFGDLVSRQLDLFEDDARPLLDDAAEADSAWTKATREDSEELYGDYQLVVDEIAERLLDTRETYAATLDERAAEEYRTAFDRAARKRFRRFAGLLDDD